MWYAEYVGVFLPIFPQLRQDAQPDISGSVNFHMTMGQKPPEIVFLRIDASAPAWYNQTVICETLMTDGSVEHHTE